MARVFTEGQKAARAVMSVMKDWPLEPGQALFMGPASVQILQTPGAFKGTLPDTFVMERDEWANAKCDPREAASPRRATRPRTAKRKARV